MGDFCDYRLFFLFLLFFILLLDYLFRLAQVRHLDVRKKDIIDFKKLKQSLINII